METKKLQSGLERANSRSELFQRKNAKLEKDNDQLRIENQELIQSVTLLQEQLAALQKKLSTHEHKESDKDVTPSLGHEGTTDPQTGLSPDPISKGSKEDKVSYEVKTLRKVKKELENQLKASKSSTLSFQASFQAEFDLRTQTEQRLEQLRERYERLVMENDQLRTLLRNNKIEAPSPPGIFSLPGSRRKRRPPHLTKARSVSVYLDSDLSKYTPRSNQPLQTNGQSTHSERSSSSEKRKASAQATSSSKTNGSHDSSGVHPPSVSPTAVTDTSSTKMSGKDTAEQSTGDGSSLPEVESQSKPGTHTECNSSKNNTTGQSNIKETEEPKDDHGTLSPQNAPSERKVAFPADTILRNAQGYLARMEKMSDIPDVSEGEEKVEAGNPAEEKESCSTSPPHEESEKNVDGVELGIDEMMSVSTKQLQNAKAFYAQIQASTKRASLHDPDTDGQL